MKIKVARTGDLRALYAHLIRHGAESGKNNDYVFAPYDEPCERPWAEFKTESEKRWTLSLSECGWERCWFLVVGKEVRGHLRLRHAAGLQTSLHRALLMMGIENGYRGKGHGSEFMCTSLKWAKTKKSLAWVQLNVFAHNRPARALYRKFGFKRVGYNRDLFRVQGQPIDDIEMSVRL